MKKKRTYSFKVKTITNHSIDIKKLYKGLKLWSKPASDIKRLIKYFEDFNDKAKELSTYKSLLKTKESCDEDIKKLKSFSRTKYSYEITCVVDHLKILKPIKVSMTKDTPFLTMDDRKYFIDKIKSHVRSNREKQRHIRRHAGRLQEYMYNLGSDNSFCLDNIGGVHLEPNSIYKAYKLKLCRTMFSPKSPKTEDLYIGIELEFAIPKDLNKQDLAYKLFGTGFSKNMYLKYDTSVKDFSDKYNSEGKELNILAKMDEFPEVVSKICKVLNEVGSKVNQTCGLHIHLDHRNMSRSDALINAKKLIKAQNLLYSMVPNSRSTSRYCKKSDYNSIENEDKYCGINVRPLNSLGTIEVRIHSGTLNSRKIINWVKILHKILKMPKEWINTTSDTPRSFNGWMKVLDITEENNTSLYNYIKARQERFKDANDTDSSNFEQDLKEEEINDNIELALSFG